MNYDQYESSVQDGQPIELYLFTYNGQNYQYTSAQYTQQFVDNGIYYAFSPEYVVRGPSLKLGDSGGTVETCTITVLRTNSVALLYQGAPPENDSVRCRVFRTHGNENGDVRKILDGTVSQVRFHDSVAELTITIENVLNRYIPKGTLSYHCQNCIYDDKCTLDAELFKFDCTADGGVHGLVIYSTHLLYYPSGYFDFGGVQMGNSLRAIVRHQDNWIIIKYPINAADLGTTFTVWPGCANTFRNCALKFMNIQNFNGIPYIQPYDAFKHPTGKGAYWIDDQVIKRDTHGDILEPNPGW